MTRTPLAALGLSLALAVPVAAQQRTIQQMHASALQQASELHVAAVADPAQPAECAGPLPSPAWMLSWPAEIGFSGTYLVKFATINGAPGKPPSTAWPKGTIAYTPQVEAPGQYVFLVSAQVQTYPPCGGNQVETRVVSDSVRIMVR